MNGCAVYTKQMPEFFQFLLGKITKISIYSIPGTPQPHENTHYQVKKSGIEIYTSHIIKLSHEIAHMVEVKNNEKLIQNDFGIPTYFPKTQKGKLQAIARESRTRGIQTRLVENAFGNCQLLKFKKLPLDIVSANGKFKNYLDALDWSTTICNSAYKFWTTEKIIDIWEEKSIIINNFLETA